MRLNIFILIITFTSNLAFSKMTTAERIRNLIPLNPNTVIHPQSWPSAQAYEINQCINQAFPGPYNPDAIEMIDNLLSQSLNLVDPLLRVNPGHAPGHSNPLFIEVVSRIRNEISSLNQIWQTKEIHQHDMETIAQITTIISTYNFYANKIENLDMLPENALNIGRIIIQFQRQLILMQNCLLPIVQRNNNDMATRINDDERQLQEKQSNDNSAAENNNPSALKN